MLPRRMARHRQTCLSLLHKKAHALRRGNRIKFFLTTENTEGTEFRFF